MLCSGTSAGRKLGVWGRLTQFHLENGPHVGLGL